MRLGTCIALELTVAAGAVFGVFVGVGYMAEVADSYVPEAAAAPPALLVTPAPLPRSTLQVSFTEPKPTIFGKPDSELIDALGEGTVTKIKLNRGGTSLSLRLDFSNGTRAAFKPEQTFPQSDPRREIAAYRIDRLLGLDHVAPSKAIAIPYKELVDAAEPGMRAYVAERLEDAIVRNGIVYGEVQWWIPDIKLAAFGRHRIDEHEGKAIWQADLQVGAKIPPERRTLLEQLSALILFDCLIDNADRWSGANTMMSPDGQVLFFMDNTLSFSIHKFGHFIPNNMLKRVQVFPRGLVARLRSLTYSEVERVLDVGDDKRLGLLLQPEQIKALIARRDNILTYVDKLIAQFGEDAVLALP